MDHETKNAVDVLAGAVGLATLLNWLPAIASAMTIVWTLMRMWEWVRDKRWRKVNESA